MPPGIAEARMIVRVFPDMANREDAAAMEWSPAEEEGEGVMTMVVTKPCEFVTTEDTTDVMICGDSDENGTWPNVPELVGEDEGLLLLAGDGDGVVTVDEVVVVGS